ncbi:MAG: DUF4411 family protein [Acidobacteria bacterium]|nr:DUF4411 family protein [Acidobacteriota bacterium]
MTASLFPGYILDTCTIIEICRRMRPPELRQSALLIVENLVQTRQIKSPEEVYLELKDHATSGDVVLAWCNRNRVIFEDMTDQQQRNLAMVLSDFGNSVKVNIRKFDADPILVAMSLEIGWTVVTRDGYGALEGKIGVHQMCDRFNVRCITEFEFLKENGWKV